MNRNITLVCVLAWGLFCSSAVRGQEGGGAGGWVVVLDVAKVFKSNAEFDTRMKQIREEAESLQATFKQEQEAIQRDAQPLQELTEATAKFQLEAQLEQRTTALKTKARQREAELLSKEAAAYYQTYQKMEQVVASLAERHGIVLVLRFDSDEIDPTNRGEVIKGVNRAVVYHKQLDITEQVIGEMGPTVSSAPSEKLR